MGNPFVATSPITMAFGIIMVSFLKVIFFQISEAQ